MFRTNSWYDLMSTKEAIDRTGNAEKKIFQAIMRSDTTHSSWEDILQSTIIECRHSKMTEKDRKMNLVGRKNIITTALLS